MEDIEAGLQALVEEVRQRGIRSIAIPPLGCGLGGLRWADVRAKIEAAFKDLEDVQVLLYEPKGAPPVKAPKPSIRRLKKPMDRANESA
jgi:O-acetyl-ADP-ribose deacetylase (regulator of RNase III)